MLHWQIKHGDPKNWMQTSDSINWADAVAQANASWSSVNSADQNAGGGFGDASSRFITKRNEWYNGATSAINTHNQNTEDSANAAVDYEYNQNLALKTKNTTLNNYSRQVTNQMMKVAPKNTKYVYIGPIDDKTRPICLKMWSAGTLTLKEIDEKFPARFVEGGGFNCRHQWTPLELEAKSKDFRTDATKER